MMQSGHGTPQHGVSNSQLLARAAEIPEWKAVRRWVGLSGEDKLAWLFLWTQSRGASIHLPVTAAEVSADQGTGSNAGKRRFTNLEAVGLLRIVRSKAGQYTVELLNPFEVIRARKIEADPQQELPFEEPEQFTSVAAEAEHVHLCSVPDPPRNRDGTVTEPGSNLIPSKKESISSTSTSPSTWEGSETTAAAGSVTVPSRNRHDAVSSDEIAEVSYLANRILEMVACHKMIPAAAKNAARLVVDGTIPKSDLEELLENTVRKKKNGGLEGPASAYFNGGIKNLVAKWKSKG